MKRRRTVAAILGAGQLGRAVAEVLAQAGTEVHLWARREATVRALQRRFKNVQASTDLAKAVAGARVVFLAVPASGFREVAGLYGEVAEGDHIVLHATHGVGDGFVLPHQMVREETCARKIAVLGGPLQARDLATGRPLAAVVASRFDEAVQAVRRAVEGTRVSLHASHDVVGVEVAGAFSLVSSLAVGLGDALKLGETARGVLSTRSLAEAGRLGAFLGADPMTFAGLAGVGDLLPRKLATADRHRAVATALVEGQPLEEALAALKGEAEGVTTVREAARTAAAQGLDLPLVTALDAVLGGRADPRAALEGVLALELDLGRGFVRG